MADHTVTDTWLTALRNHVATALGRTSHLKNQSYLPAQAPDLDKIWSELGIVLTTIDDEQHRKTLD